MSDLFTTPDGRPTTGIAVDGSCLIHTEGTPCQWQGVNLQTGEKLFCSEPFLHGSAPLAEFLAIIHGMAVTTAGTLTYSDSTVARNWVQKGYALKTESRSQQLQKIIVRANNFLKENQHRVVDVRCWETRNWGENAADFQRKKKRKQVTV